MGRLATRDESQAAQHDRGGTLSLARAWASRPAVRGTGFGTADGLECSWVICTTWLPHQRLELENDLIAAHLLAVGSVPAGQFLGEQSNESGTAQGVAVR